MTLLYHQPHKRGVRSCLCEGFVSQFQL